MNHKKQLERPEKSRCPYKRAAASFLGRAKNGITNNLLLKGHYFYLNLAESPVALVVMGIGRKKETNIQGVGA